MSIKKALRTTLNTLAMSQFCNSDRYDGQSRLKWVGSFSGICYVLSNMHAAVRVGDLDHEGINEFISVLSWNVHGQLTQRGRASYLLLIDYVIQRNKNQFIGFRWCPVLNCLLI